MRYRQTSQTPSHESVLNGWVLIATLFMLSLLALAVIKTVGFGVVGWYVALGLTTFWLYRHDKYAAKHDSWRIQESTLHKLALAGGWVGAAFAHKLLRHKSQKPEFRKGFYLTVFGNVVALMLFWWFKWR